MDLILWRHCDAEAGVPDELRTLTSRGRADAARMAQWLRGGLPPDCRIVASPAVRARQTAEALGLLFETKSELMPGASVFDVLRVADGTEAVAATLIVGHEPTLGRVAAHLLGVMGERPLEKGGVVWLALRPPDAQGAEATLVAEASPQTLPRS
ncbi:MAG TPA: histidine phosphatase family protein [Casimicrobiaceae bacterium]|nr:histidine phosphatase family protein [Casimicrobiaceae bacterium]